MAVKVKIGLIQMKAGEDCRKNLDRACGKIAAACRRGAKLICLQELFQSPYFCQKESTRFFKYAQTLTGPAADRLLDLSKQWKALIIAPLFERRAKGIYHNTALIMDTGNIIGRYRKMHIPDDPYYHEKFYFTPGDSGFEPIETRFGKIGVLICWDQWFPEAARLMALKGARILFYPTAIGAIRGTSPRLARQEKRAWQTIQISHAIANGIYVASVNRTGEERKIRFWGSSFVADPAGEVVSRGRTQDEDIVYAECDLKKITKIRQEWPFLRDRRIDAYKGLLSRYADAAS